jgi:hypothetical protein
MDLPCPVANACILGARFTPEVVVDGTVVAGADLSVATINFLAQGGDQYPFRGLPFTQLGVTYQQALAGYLEGPLAGQVTSAMYPVGGEGRIVTVPYTE